MHTYHRFILRIIFPSIATVLLFIAAIFFIVIPNYRESLMNGKRETLRELTNTAWSVMHKLDLMVTEDFDLEQAKNEASLIISDMRWGNEMKDYFWIIDNVPVMIMHPYLPALNGMDLSDYKDPEKKKLFVEMVAISKESGDGYVDYKWQRKDDSLTIVPKLSYVKSYKPWGWIVGTGIYIDDVNREISNLTRKVVWISIFITILTGALIIHLARRNFMADMERQKYQDDLKGSMEKYKKLVEASTDGVLMMVNDEIVYCNNYLINILGYTQEEYITQNQKLGEAFKVIIGGNKSTVPANNSFEPGNSAELRLNKANGLIINVVVSRSSFDMAGKSGLICTIKDVSKHKDVERELDLSMEKFKSIANLLNVGIFRCTVGRNARFVEINSKGLDLLGYVNLLEFKNIKIQDLIEVISERKEVISAIREGGHIKERLLHLKRSDGTILSSIVSLFPVTDLHGNLVFCDGIIIDAYNHIGHEKTFSKSSTNLHLSANIFLQPISRYMSSAPWCNLDTPVNIASKLMTKSNADVLLVINENNKIIGLLTHSDLSRRVIALSGSISVPVSQVMSSPVISVNEGDMVIDAFNLMMQHRISYVVVKSNNSRKYYYISLLSLSEMRKDSPEFIINSITKSESVYELTEIFNQLPRIVKNLVQTGTGVTATGAFISKISDSITNKLINDAIISIGKPPAPFVFMALGSEGRKEQTLATDQDNAIVYIAENGNHDVICQDYFIKLGAVVCDMLNTAGYPFCRGGVMAMNRSWCMGYSSWEKVITGWITVPNPQEILNISIFFDFRPIYGNFEIADDLQSFCKALLKDKHVFFFNLAKTVLSLKPTGMDNINNSSGYDIKLPLLAITSIARLWSLKFGVSERNSIERLNSLETIGAISTNLKSEFEQGIEFLMNLRLKNQLRQIEGYETAGNNIQTRYLSNLDRILLKRYITTIYDHLNKITTDFRIV